MKTLKELAEQLTPSEILYEVGEDNYKIVFDSNPGLSSDTFIVKRAAPGFGGWTTVFGPEPLQVCIDYVVVQFWLYM